jgi:hypothetical protein
VRMPVLGVMPRLNGTAPPVLTTSGRPSPLTAEK